MTIVSAVAKRVAVHPKASMERTTTEEYIVCGQKGDIFVSLRQDKSWIVTRFSRFLFLLDHS